MKITDIATLPILITLVLMELLETTLPQCAHRSVFGAEEIIATSLTQSMSSLPKLQEGCPNYCSALSIG